MCILFVVFVGGMFAASAYGFKNGDPMKMAIGWDSDRQGCGYSPGMEEYKYLYWSKTPDPEILKTIKNDLTGGKGGVPDQKKIKEVMNKAFGLLNDGMCVKSCPGEKAEGVKTWPKVECSPTKRLKKLTKTLNNA